MNTFFGEFSRRGYRIFPHRKHTAISYVYASCVSLIGFVLSRCAQRNTPKPQHIMKTETKVTSLEAALAIAKATGQS